LLPEGDEKVGMMAIGAIGTSEVVVISWLEADVVAASVVAFDERVAERVVEIVPSDERTEATAFISVYPQVRGVKTHYYSIWKSRQPIVWSMIPSLTLKMMMLTLIPL
jgi:hypothetical protein